MKDSYIVILGGGKSQLPFVNSGLKLGYKIILIDKNSKAIGVKKSNIFINISTHNANHIVNKIRGLDVKVVGLIARTTGKALNTAAIINKNFNLIGINHELAEISISKSKLREFLNKIDVPSPNGENIGSISDNIGSDLYSKYGDVVIKPEITVVGKENIFLCRSENEIRDRISKSMSSSYNKRAEVQEYINGKDSCLFVWFSKGEYEIVLSWDEHNSFHGLSNNLTGNYISMPAEGLSEKSKKITINCCERFAEYFCKASFLLAFSFRFDSNDNGYLIEVHADLTGDSILEDLAPKSTGVDFFDKIVNLHVNGNISTNYKMKNERIKHP